MRTFEWDAPARLFFWPGGEGWDEAAVYPSLRAALEAAGEGDLSAAWIVTRNGDIISPRLVTSLREEMVAPPIRRRREATRTFFGWARAA
jgi:hypothetical protein